MFKKRELGREMAFGRIPAYCRYELFMERYRFPAEVAAREFCGRETFSVLDIGSGRGRLKYFFDFNPHIAWHGIEVNEEMARICSGIGYRMHRHDIERSPLPFPDASFDLVAGLHVLEHLADPARALRDMARVLKPKGLLVLGVPIKPPGIAELIAVYYHLRQTLRPEQGRTRNAFSSMGFTRLLRQVLHGVCDILDVRGFRLFSARKRLPLENRRWFYDLNTRFGRRFPSFTPEVNVILKKRNRP
jgi:SAM-dependent methyltransferase